MINPDNSLAIDAIQNQGVVGRVLTRHVGLKPDLRPNGLSGINKQRGSTLLVALVMLVLLTLIALSSMNATTTSIQEVGNAQFREEANAAVQQAIEGVISSNFTALPAASSIPVDMNSNGTTDATVQVAVPTCMNSMPLTNNLLDETDPRDEVCISSGRVEIITFGPSGLPVSTAPSWCFLQTWQVDATVSDSATGANARISQGVSLRVPAGTTC